MKYEYSAHTHSHIDTNALYQLKGDQAKASEHLVAIFGKQEKIAHCIMDSGYKVVELPEEAIDPNILCSLQPSLAIVDWKTERSFGLEICRHLLRILPNLAIILLTSDDSVNIRISALNAGALSCVAKPYILDELLARVRVHTRNLPATSKTVLRCGSFVLNLTTREVYCDMKKIMLTAKEFDLLKLLMTHKNQVMTRHRIIQNVWGYDFIGESNLIEVYISSLRKKLQQPNRASLIHTVRMVGYVLKTIPSNT